MTPDPYSELPYFSYAGYVPVILKRNGEEHTGSLPVWCGRDGSIRIGVPVEDPQHSTDMLQIVTTPADLMQAVGIALGSKPC